MIKTIQGLEKTLSSHNTDEWMSRIKNKELKKLRNINEIPEKDHMKVDNSKLSNRGRTFGQFLSEAIGNVNQLQKDANRAIEELATGKNKSIHETMLAVEKADIAFKAMNQIRNKLLEAYKEMMRMQV